MSHKITAFRNQNGFQTNKTKPLQCPWEKKGQQTKEESIVWQQSGLSFTEDLEAASQYLHGLCLKDYFNSGHAPKQKNALWPLGADSPVCQSNVKHVWNGRKDF